MNKTVSVNIGGLVFNVEEIAYNKLQRYLSTIRNYFNESDGREEIMNDIEVRIAELFQERVRPSKQVITDLDVDEVIEIMGQPEAYIENDEADKHNHDTREEEPDRQRKMYRDPDDSIIAGVCSGIAQYFGWDRTWVRLAFALAFIFAGTGVLVYLVLWFILPEAQTTAEKLEMRGEAVNVENIKEHFNRFKDDLRDLGNRRNRQKFHGAARQIGEGLGKIIGVIMFILGIAFTAILIYWLFAQDFVFNISNAGPEGFTFDELLSLTLYPTQSALLNVGLTLLMLGPIIAFFATGFRLSLGIRSSSKVVGVISTSLWLIGLSVAIVFGISFWRSIQAEHVAHSEIEMDQPSNNTITVHVTDDEFFSNEYDDPENYFWELMRMENERVYIGWPELDIVKSNSGRFELHMSKRSRGGTRMEAIERSKSIEYDVI